MLVRYAAEGAMTDEPPDVAPELGAGFAVRERATQAEMAEEAGEGGTGGDVREYA